MADTNYYTPNTTKMRARDRIFKLGVIDDKLPKNSTGMVDTRLFTGENNLHAKMDPETCFWSLQYDSGALPQPLENNFTKGLITEFTGLNFPENAATVSDNTEYTIIGDVIRREGIDTEVNGITNTVDRTNKAISSYKWNNASGDGLTQIVVEQIGNTLYFYKSSSTTTALPLSRQLLTSTISLAVFTASGGTLDSTLECQYADGNGYLFVYHPSCDPFYCTYNAGVIVGNVITIQTRDFTGLPEVNLPINSRPPTLSDPHFYNLQNQGWQSAKLWSTNSSTL